MFDNDLGIFGTSYSNRRKDWWNNPFMVMMTLHDDAGKEYFMLGEIETSSEEKAKQVMNNIPKGKGYKEALDYFKQFGDFRVYDITEETAAYLFNLWHDNHLVRSLEGLTFAAWATGNINSWNSDRYKDKARRMGVEWQYMGREVTAV